MQNKQQNGGGGNKTLNEQLYKIHVECDVNEC